MSHIVLVCNFTLSIRVHSKVKQNSPYSEETEDFSAWFFCLIKPLKNLQNCPYYVIRDKIQAVLYPPRFYVLLIVRTVRIVQYSTVFSQSASNHIKATIIVIHPSWFANSYGSFGRRGILLRQKWDWVLWSFSSTVLMPITWQGKQQEGDNSAQNILSITLHNIPPTVYPLNYFYGIFCEAGFRILSKKWTELTWENKAGKSV